MDNCKNCAGTIGKDDVCSYCGTYHGPQKINTRSFRKEEVEDVQYGGLTAAGKIIVAMFVIGFAFTLKWVCMDSGYVFKKETKETIPMLHVQMDTTGMPHIMQDGDMNLVMYHWNAAMATTDSTGEDNILNK